MYYSLLKYSFEFAFYKAVNVLLKRACRRNLWNISMTWPIKKKIINQPTRRFHIRFFFVANIYYYKLILHYEITNDCSTNWKKENPTTLITVLREFVTLQTFFILLQSTNFVIGRLRSNTVTIVGQSSFEEVLGF